MPKKIIPLSEVQCKNFKPNPSANRKISDGGGLYLFITPSGSKLWRFKYRLLNKENLLSFGKYPEVTLAMARDERAKSRAQLAKGIDPSNFRRAEMNNQQEAAQITIRYVSEKWLEDNQNRLSEVYLKKTMLRMNKDVFPVIGHMPISTLNPADILALLRDIQKRGVLYTAHRIRMHLSTLFQYAVANNWAERDITFDIRNAIPKAKSNNYASIKDKALLARLLRDIDTYSGHLNTQLALKLAPIIFCRPGELRGMRWCELDFKQAEWRIPPSRQKILKANKDSNKYGDVIIALPTQAIGLLESHRQLIGTNEYVFPISSKRKNKTMSENTVNQALRTMGYSKDEICGHGFRHTASTMLNEERKWSPDAIERQLSHRDNSVRGIYNNADYLDERKRMIQSWADFLDNLKANF